MKHYSKERKKVALAKMLPPNNMSVIEVAEDTGISRQTLYAWRRRANEKGGVMTGVSKNPEKWSSANKFAVVVEIASLNEAEASKYCRERGLYPEQVDQWRQACESANATQAKLDKSERSRREVDQERIKLLERELRRKECALAETAALLVLKKKALHLWGELEVG